MSRACQWIVQERYWTPTTTGKRDEKVEENSLIKGKKGQRRTIKIRKKANYPIEESLKTLRKAGKEGKTHRKSKKWSKLGW